MMASLSQGSEPISVIKLLLRSHESHNHHAHNLPVPHSSQLACGLGEVGESVATLELAVLDDA